MKKLNRAISTAALAATAVAIAAGTANAATAATPAPKSPVVVDSTTTSTDIMPGVHYTGDTTDRSVAITTPVGSLTAQGNQFQVSDNKGNAVLGRPFAVAPKAVTTVAPTSAQVAAAHQVNSIDAPKSIDKSADFNSALGVAATNFGLATGVGGMVGGVAGLALGCPVGAVTGGLTFAPTVVAAPLGAIAGCLAGAAIGGTLGPIIGGAALGVPVGIASGAQMYNTLHAQGDV